MNSLLVSIHNVLPVWNVSRAAGMTSYLLLFISVVTGMSGHYSFLHPKTKAALNLVHQSTGWFGMLFGLVHGLVLTYSSYESFSLYDVFVPFASKTHPFLTGVGILALYSMVLLLLTSDYRKQLGWKLWKSIHFLAFPAFVAAFFHSVLLGPDSQTLYMQIIYYSTAVITLIALITRVAIRPVSRKRTAER